MHRVCGTGARLYTGPLFEKYCAVLRGVPGFSAFLTDKYAHACIDACMQPTHKYARDDACGPRRYKKLCLGNRYSGTIHAINSAFVKLGRISTASKLYRGVGGFRLPEAFLSPDEFGAGPHMVHHPHRAPLPSVHC